MQLRPGEVKRFSLPAATSKRDSVVRILLDLPEAYQYEMRSDGSSSSVSSPTSLWASFRTSTPGVDEPRQEYVNKVNIVEMSDSAGRCECRKQGNGNWKSRLCWLSLGCQVSAATDSRLM